MSRGSQHTSSNMFHSRNTCEVGSVERVTAAKATFLWLRVGLNFTLCIAFPKVMSPYIPIRLSHSSYVDEEYDSLALCDPMQRINCEVDSLPESCFDSGLSTLRDSNEYDSEVESKHQRTSERTQCLQESFPGDASDTDVSYGAC